jgi:hypothetical protein
MSYQDDEYDEDWGRDERALVSPSGYEQTRDDTDYGWGERTWSDTPSGGTDPDLERFLAERPPHHGD